jgi:hypothetical protein
MEMRYFYSQIRPSVLQPLLKPCDVILNGGRFEEPLEVHFILLLLFGHGGEELLKVSGGSLALINVFTGAGTYT